MKTLNPLVREYTRLLQQGEIQLAYRGILEFLGKLRAEFAKRYPFFDMGGVYQGTMDMSYFSLSTKPLRERGLKIAIVYLHEKGRFEAWLSARNREIAKGYASAWNGRVLGGITVFHDDGNPDSILECALSSSPDFEDSATLTDVLCRGAEAFVAAIGNLLPGG